MTAYIRETPEPAKVSSPIEPMSSGTQVDLNLPVYADSRAGESWIDTMAIATENMIASWLALGVGLSLPSFRQRSSRLLNPGGNPGATRVPGYISVQLESWMSEYLPTHPEKPLAPYGPIPIYSYPILKTGATSSAQNTFAPSTPDTSVPSMIPTAFRNSTHISDGAHRKRLRSDHMDFYYFPYPAPQAIGPQHSLAVGGHTGAYPASSNGYPFTRYTAQEPAATLPTQVAESWVPVSYALEFDLTPSAFFQSGSTDASGSAGTAGQLSSHPATNAHAQPGGTYTVLSSDAASAYGSSGTACTWQNDPLVGSFGDSNLEAAPLQSTLHVPCVIHQPKPVHFERCIKPRWLLPEWEPDVTPQPPKKKRRLVREVPPQSLNTLEQQCAKAGHSSKKAPATSRKNVSRRGRRPSGRGGAGPTAGARSL